MSSTPGLPQFRYVTPRALPPASSVVGRTVVLDVAFSSDGGGSSFDGVTLPFIKGLGSRLAAWVDHHDHERHVDYADDPRFVLSTKAEHGACPEMVTPTIVDGAGPVDTIALHLDLDGLYSGAKWVLGGVEPYAGADADARAVDTRRGTPGPIAERIDRALRARFRDETLKHRVIQFLVAGADRRKQAVLWGEIDAAAKEIDPLLDEARRLAGGYEIRDGVAFLDLGGARGFDKTELLLIGQERAPVSVLRGSGSLTIAADFESGLDFVKMFALGGGMPTRVTIPDARLGEVMQKLAAAVGTPRSGQASPAPFG
jgi:hypothetical protein